MTGASLAQAIDHVAKELVVAALVGAHRNAVRIFLDRGAHDIVDAAVVTEVNHLDALRLDQSTHDVDRRIMAIEQGRCGDKAQRCVFARTRGQIGGWCTHESIPGCQNFNVD